MQSRERKVERTKGRKQKGMMRFLAAVARNDGLRTARDAPSRLDRSLSGEPTPDADVRGRTTCVRASHVYARIPAWLGLAWLWQHERDSASLAEAGRKTEETTRMRPHPVFSRSIEEKIDRGISSTAIARIKGEQYEEES